MSDEIDAIISGMPDERRMLFARADVGMDMEQFTQSQKGRFLLGNANQELIDVRNQLETVGVNDKIGILELQQRARLLRDLVFWMQDAMEDGQQAQRSIEEEQSVD